ncbi:MAG: hypothetical protein R3C99_20660 [Pirellulaceae bacterium]
MFHSPHEVISALDRLERIRRLQNRLIRDGIGLLAVAAVLLVFFFVSWDRVQHFAYTSELRRLGEQREALANALAMRSADARVQQRIDAAQQLEQRADASNRHGNTGEASSLLRKQSTKLPTPHGGSQPSAFARWCNRSASSCWTTISGIGTARRLTRLTELGKTYQEIQTKSKQAIPTKRGD